MKRILAMLGSRKRIYWIESVSLIIAEGRPLTDDERLRKEKISKELERFILLEEARSRQKSRAL
jgi:hypothetical protein